MEALTGLADFDWILVFLYALAGVLVVGSRRRWPDAMQLLGLLAVPLLAGACLGLSLAFAYFDETDYVFSHITDRPASVAVAVLVFVTAVAFGDLFFARFAALAGRAASRLPLSTRRRADAALLLGVGIPVALAIATMPRIGDRLESGYERALTSTSGRVTVRAVYTLPGHPMDLIFRTPSEGFVSFGEGTIARFEVPLDAALDLRVTPAATGLGYPRGIAVAGDTLFVAELGPLPCTPSFPFCKGGDVEGLSVEAAERKILRTSRARVLAFDIRADGSLTNRRPIVSDLPVANSDHGVNDVVAGPDGRLYISIGNLDRLYATPGLAPDLRRPHAELLGTVVSLRPDGGDPSVYATGLRNVYALAFDRYGRLYGTDNDGPTRSGWRREEVLAIRRGANYGFPSDGTFPPYSARNEPPLWVIDTAGSAGIAWIAGPDGDGKLIVGSCGRLDSINLTESRNGRAFVAEESDVTRLLDLPPQECVTTIQPRLGGLAIGVFAFVGDSKLYLLDLDD